MINFAYARATDVADAVRRIAADPQAKFIAGGTNLIDLMKEDVERPTRLIDITRLPLKNFEETRDGGIRIAVRDEGIGIAPLEQRRIFGKFYRVDPELARGVGGTGLGLYICRELVNRLDGRIWVESNNGKGSIFCVQIPVAKARAGTARVAA